MRLRDEGEPRSGAEDRPSHFLHIGLMVGGLLLGVLAWNRVLPLPRAESELFAILGVVAVLVGLARWILSLGGSRRFAGGVIVGLLALMGGGLWLALQEAEAQEQDEANDHALLLAVSSKELEAIRAALEAGADANASSDKVTALFLAAAKGSLEAVELLLSHGADPDRPTPSGSRMTPLAVAVANDHVDVARRLLEAGADPDAQSELGSPRQLCGDNAKMRALLSNH